MSAAAAKRCPACGETLSAAAFNDSARSPDGLARVCRSCTNARRRERDRGREPRRRPAGLWVSLGRGDAAAVRRFIAAGARPDWKWVCEAARGGHLDLAQSLLGEGAAPNLFTAVALGNLAAVEELLAGEPASARASVEMEPGGRGVTPAHVACSADLRSLPDGAGAQVRVVRALRDRGADLSARARYRGMEGATPLFCACWSSGNLQLVRWLLEHGAAVDARDLAAALGHFQRHGRGSFEIAGALLEWGVPVDGVPGDRTPLQAAAAQADRAAASWLLARGADVNARGPGGRTAAHFAAERNTGPATLALLVESGGDLAAVDDDGRTPLELAALNGKRRLTEWLMRTQGRQ
jgi:ankyrin repeat protein